MTRWHLVPVTAAAAVLISCSSAPQAADPAALEASASARIQAIPLASPEKYRGMRDMRNWRNPYLIIQTDGVALLDSDNHEEHLLKPTELAQALSNLPSAAWPYGRVVAVTENGLRGSADDDVKMRQNRALVVGTLENMHVLIKWVPSA
jgi:hypothetical protein